jgi:hypothetical protein
MVALGLLVHPGIVFGGMFGYDNSEVTGWKYKGLIAKEA